MQNEKKRNYQQHQPQKELTPEEIFELKIKAWRKQSEDRLNDIRKNKDRKTKDTRYCLSPFRFVGGRS